MLALSQFSIEPSASSTVHARVVLGHFVDLTTEFFCFGSESLSKQKVIPMQHLPYILAADFPLILFDHSLNLESRYQDVIIRLTEVSCDVPVSRPHPILGFISNHIDSLSPSISLILVPNSFSVIFVMLFMMLINPRLKTICKQASKENSLNVACSITNKSAHCIVACLKRANARIQCNCQGNSSLRFFDSLLSFVNEYQRVSMSHSFIFHDCLEFASHLIPTELFDSMKIVGSCRFQYSKSHCRPE